MEIIMKSYVETLHEVVKNCNWYDDGEKDWRRDGNDCERRHDLFVEDICVAEEKGSVE
jgi:hypothetical protein